MTDESISKKHGRPDAGPLPAGCMAAFFGMFAFMGGLVFVSAPEVTSTPAVMVPALFVLVGVWGIFMSLRPGGFAGRSAPAAAAGPGPRWLDSLDTPVRLEPTSTPTSSFMGITMFAVIWNGILSVFVMQLVQDWQRGHVSYFMALFLTPFLLIGVLTLLGVVHSFLSIFNPRVVVVAGKGRMRLGDTIPLDWTVEGHADRINGLTLTLEGQEKATYVRGTDRRTDTSTFHRSPVAFTEDRFMIRRGSASLDLPVDTVPSFKAPSNEIVWILRVQGEIAWWPDICDEYTLTLEPAPSSKGAKS